MFCGLPFGVLAGHGDFLKTQINFDCKIVLSKALGDSCRPSGLLNFLFTNLSHFVKLTNQKRSRERLLAASGLFEITNETFNALLFCQKPRGFLAALETLSKHKRNINAVLFCQKPLGGIHGSLGDSFKSQMKLSTHYCFVKSLGDSWRPWRLFQNTNETFNT